MTKEELKTINPWNEVADLMAQTNKLWFENTELVCSQDRAFVHDYNKRVKDEYRFELRTPPFPFVGNILEAKVIILSLNPGYVEWQNKVAAIGLENMDRQIAEAISKTQQQFLRLEGTSIYETPYREEILLGDQYWQKMLRPVSQSTGLSEKDVYKSFAVVQLCGYSSAKFSDRKELYRFASYDFMLKVLQYLNDNNNCIFLVMRHVTKWKSVLSGIKILDNLMSTGRFIENQSHYGLQYVTENNLSKATFDTIVNHLKS